MSVMTGTVEVRCAVAHDVAKALRKEANQCERIADGDVSDMTRDEYRMEARVLRSVSRVIDSINRSKT